MSGKLPKVSVIGGGSSPVGNRSGFEKLPDSDTAGTAVILAARKSRQQKNIVAIKIGLVIVTVSALVAGLAAFFIIHGAGNLSLSPELHFADRRARTMEINIDNKETLKKVGVANDEFATDLYSQMKKDAADDANILFSPFSASTVLSMAAMGAGGKTEKQMTTGLHLPDMTSAASGYKQVIPALRTNENFTLETANAAFVMKDYEIVSNFKESLHLNFHADISPVDFGDNVAAAKNINSWVKDMTKEKIEDLIDKDSINALTRLILVNAVYFKGDWETKFNAKHTKKDEFFVSNNKNVNADMMKIEESFDFAELDGIQSKMVELPYKGDRIVMQILLPNEKTGLAAVETKMSEVDINKMFEENKRETKLLVKMPKFKSSYESELSEGLKKMGMTDMFEAGTADFSGIDGTRNLYVAFVKQKVFIEVNEEGSEAAAATGMGMMMRSMPLPPEQFTVDHPFIFFIRDKLTGMLLFQGRISDPTAE